MTTKQKYKKDQSRLRKNERFYGWCHSGLIDRPLKLKPNERNSGYMKIRGIWRFNSTSLNNRINRRANLFFK
jgi:hypothetical protein